MRKQIWIFDFDGTITLDDVGNAVCDHFAPPGWRALENEWLEGKISLGEAQRDIWAQVSASKVDAQHFAKTVTSVRPGLLPLLRHVAERGGESWIASGGFDFYIEPLLGSTIKQFTRTYFNRAHFAGRGVGVEFPFPELACPSCALCKGKICDLAAATGAEVVFVGDGPSDRCVIGRCHELAVIEDSFLKKYAQTQGGKFRIFKDFSELIG